MKNNNLHIENDAFLAKWMVEEITNAELKKLVSENDFLVYNKLKKGILLYEELEAPLDNQFKEIQNKIDKAHAGKLNNRKSKVKKLYSTWAISVAASLVLFISVYTFLGNKSVLNKTNFGIQKTFNLLDGSEVRLHTKSEITYNKDNWNNRRDVYLNGEAFFKVKKGSKFTVKTKNGNIEVLGTQFNVNSNKDYFEVVCYSGKVKVIYNDKEYLLLPTQGFRKINGNAIENISTQQIAPTWLNGINTYKSVPIKYVILDLEKQFNVKFKTTKIDTNLLFTGNFNHKDKQLAFTTVFRAMNINYNEIDTKTIELVKDK